MLRSRRARGIRQMHSRGMPLEPARSGKLLPRLRDPWPIRAAPNLPIGRRREKFSFDVH